MEAELKLTSEEWNKKLFPNNEVIVLDPDGWDRSAEGWQYSWFEEPITENEFMIRVFRSTCHMKTSFLDTLNSYRTKLS